MALGGRCRSQERSAGFSSRSKGADLPPWSQGPALPAGEEDRFLLPEEALLCWSQALLPHPGPHHSICFWKRVSEVCGLAGLLR